jgi:hypothetical protein
MDQQGIDCNRPNRNRAYSRDSWIAKIIPGERYVVISPVKFVSPTPDAVGWFAEVDAQKPLLPVQFLISLVIRNVSDSATWVSGLRVEWKQDGKWVPLYVPEDWNTMYWRQLDGPDFIGSEFDNFLKNLGNTVLKQDEVRFGFIAASSVTTPLSAVEYTNQLLRVTIYDLDGAERHILNTSIEEIPHVAQTHRPHLVINGKRRPQKDARILLR